MIVVLWSAILDLLWVALVYAPLEVLRPARPRRGGGLRPGWWADVASYFGQAVVLLPVFTAILYALSAPLRESVLLGLLRWLLGAPEFHRAPHAATWDAGHYANLAPWIDVLFGTHGDCAEPAVLGVSEPHPEGWLRLLIWPLRPR